MSADLERLAREACRMDHTSPMGSDEFARILSALRAAQDLALEEAAVLIEECASPIGAMLAIRALKHKQASEVAAPSDAPLPPAPPSHEMPRREVEAAEDDGTEPMTCCDVCGKDTPEEELRCCSECGCSYCARCEGEPEYFCSGCP